MNVKCDKKKVLMLCLVQIKLFPIWIWPPSPLKWSTMLGALLESPILWACQGPSAICAGFSLCQNSSLQLEIHLWKEEDVEANPTSNGVWKVILQLPLHLLPQGCHFHILWCRTNVNHRWSLIHVKNSTSWECSMHDGSAGRNVSVHKVTTFQGMVTNSCLVHILFFIRADLWILSKPHLFGKVRPHSNILPYMIQFYPEEVWKHCIFG